ncbi:ROK family protein [uncultured Clostridium sp.]|uniref:ROK family protein n=1 Tax=uncultured Clostridium sp. TaxID=59620 RepID=UPI0026083366|nr:ROK family protein [uncultured Clostridium sp.]
MKNILGIDIGGTSIKFGVLSKNGEIIFKDKMKTLMDGEYIIKSICFLFNENKEKYSLEGIAISAPGFINVDTGYMRTGGAIMDFYDFNLKEVLVERLNTKVEIENDANCVVLAEKWLGNAKECKNFMAMTIGTGIGGGIYINDSLYRGAKFGAGEFGFMITHGISNNVIEQCTMSQTGSTRGIREDYAKSIGEDIENINGEYLFEQYGKGDIIAESVINKFYEVLTIGIYNLFFIMDPEKILIGGGVSEREDLIPEIKRRLKAFTKDEINLEACKFSNDSGIIGAVKNYIDRN